MRHIRKIALLVAVLSLFSSLQLHAQFGNSGSSSHSYTGASAGYYLLPLSALNKGPESWGIKTGFSNAIGVGIDRGAVVQTEKLSHAAVTMLSFHYLLPQEVKSSNDSVKFKLNGYNFQFDLVSFNFLKSDNVVLTGGLAWAFGRLKMTETLGTNVTTFTNPYFDPQLRLEFHVRLGDHFFIGARGAYRYDWGKTAWKASGSAPALNPVQQSGATASAFIGFGK